MSVLSSKKKILVSITLIEIVLGTIFLVNYHQKQLARKKMLSANSVTVISRENTITPQSDDLKYYWEFAPSRIHYSQSEWLSPQAIYHINDDGLNDLSNYKTQKPKKTYRIITLGDSFTFGDYVSTQHNWTEQLEQLLNNSSRCEYDYFEVINLGMSGFDVQYIVKRYLDVGVKYDADLILWFESDSGFIRFNELVGSSVESCEEDDSDTNINKKKESYYYCHDQAEEEMGKKYSPEHLNSILDDNFKTFFNVADQEKTMFFYYDEMYPEKENAIKKMKEKYESASFIASIPELPKKEKFVDGHPNEMGHKAMSRSIFEYLVENRLDCSN